MINLKKIIKLIIDILTYILIAIVGLYLLFALYNKFINKNNKFLIGKYYIFQIATGSMENELFAGDYIIVEKSDNYKVGDIITYMEDDYYITHRINEMTENEIVTKGDANNSSDNPISRDKIVGKFLFKERILTYLTKYKVMVIAVLIALIIYESAFAEDKNKKDIDIKDNLETLLEKNDTNDSEKMEVDETKIIEVQDEKIILSEEISEDDNKEMISSEKIEESNEELK